MSLFIGLMSGTSLDGVDGVLADIEPSVHGHGAIRVLAYQQAGFPDELRATLLRLNSRGDDELHQAALAANAGAARFASSSASTVAIGRYAPSRSNASDTRRAQARSWS